MARDFLTHADVAITSCQFQRCNGRSRNSLKAERMHGQSEMVSRPWPPEEPERPEPTGRVTSRKPGPRRPPHVHCSQVLPLVCQLSFHPPPVTAPELAFGGSLFAVGQESTVNTEPVGVR